MSRDQDIESTWARCTGQNKFTESKIPVSIKISNIDYASRSL